MLKLTLDPEQIQKILDRKGWSYADLADNIQITYKPTERVVEEWKRGNVSKRWIEPLSTALEIDPETLKTKRTAAVALRPVPSDTLIRIEALEGGLTRSAVGAWLADGGGIDVERLLGLCETLGVEPYQILSKDTRELLVALARGKSNKGSDLSAKELLF